MLNPVVLPLPAALAVVAALTYVALLLRSWQTAAVPQPTVRAGQHRLGVVADPYRPRNWIALAAERTAEIPIDYWCQPTIEIAGHDDHPTERALAVITGELVTV
jgi:hypothetical protein